jgi:hypothetical protein
MDIRFHPSHQRDHSQWHVLFCDMDTLFHPSHQRHFWCKGQVSNKGQQVGFKQWPCFLHPAWSSALFLIVCFILWYGHTISSKPVFILFFVIRMIKIINVSVWFVSRIKWLFESLWMHNTYLRWKHNYCTQGEDTLCGLNHPPHRYEMSRLFLASWFLTTSIQQQRHATVNVRPNYMPDVEYSTQMNHNIPILLIYYLK